MTQHDATKGTLIMLTRPGMGHADAELSQKLLFNYLKLLHDSDLLPGAICCYAEGVRVAVEGSPVLEPLAALEARGVPIILCMTCLKYFQLDDKVKVGVVGGMPDIIAAQWKADKVITL